MRVQTNGKVKRSASEWRAIFKRFEASAMSQAAFCWREKIAKGSFSNWKKRFEEEEESGGTPGGFVEVGPVLPAPPTSFLDPGELELSLPGGVRLRWRV